MLCIMHALHCKIASYNLKVQEVVILVKSKVLFLKDSYVLRVSETQIDHHFGIPIKFFSMQRSKR